METKWLFEMFSKVTGILTLIRATSVRENWVFPVPTEGSIENLPHPWNLAITQQSFKAVDVSRISFTFLNDMSEFILKFIVSLICIIRVSLCIISLCIKFICKGDQF